MAVLLEGVVVPVGAPTGLVLQQVPDRHPVRHLARKLRQVLAKRVVEPELSQLAEAARKRSSLSVQDHLCLVVAQRRSWTCVTNDTVLRRACSAAGVSVLWGLEVMAGLVRLGQLEAGEAVAVAQAIHRSNPLHLPQNLVDRFAQAVQSIERGRGDG